MIYDDFNDNSLDPLKWMVNDLELPGTVNEIYSHLQITSGSTQVTRTSITSRTRVTVEQGAVISANVTNMVEAAVNPFTVALFGCYSPSNMAGELPGDQGIGPSIIVGGFYGFRCHVGAGYFVPQQAPAFVDGQDYFLEIEFVSSAQVDMRIDGVTVYSGAYAHNPDYAVYCMMDTLGANPVPIAVFFDNVSLPDFVISIPPSPIKPGLIGKRDLKLVLNNGRFDIALKDQDLAVDHWLLPAIYISLFTDRQAQEGDQIPDGSDDRRGWWRDPKLGSRLWLLLRSKQTKNTLITAQGYVQEALQWLIDTGKVKSLNVNTDWSDNGWMIISISILLNDGSEFKELFNYDLKG